MIRQFYELMASHGCQPRSETDIIADDKKRYIAHVQDKPRAKTLSYQLKQEGDVWVGWFYSFKFGNPGETISYFSKTDRKLTAGEREIQKAKIAQQKKLAKERDRKRAASQLRMANRLTKIYEQAPECEKHAYLATKKISPKAKSRAKGNELLVPAYKDDGLVWSMQTINGLGEKLFTKGGALSGGFHTIGEPVDEVIIAEGYATAVTIYERTNIPTICAFTAGNLLSVAKLFKDKGYSIIIAADNDRFTQIGGEPYNTGVVKGTIAAEAVGGRVIIPQFESGRGTDWNDHVNEYGPDQLLAAVHVGAGGTSFDVVSLADASPSPQKQNDWKAHLSVDGRGNLIKTSLRNTILYLQYHDDYKGVFRLNDFHKEIYMVRCPEWEDADTFAVKRLDDQQITCCAANMEKHGLHIDQRKMLSSIVVAAEDNKFHPAREYFEGIKWDKKKRLDTWLVDYLGAAEDAKEYLAFIGKKWLTAGVKRIFEPGCKFDHILVIEGVQGEGKSAALEALATFGKENPEAYFTDNIKIADIQNKDTILLLQGSIIVELAELAGFNKKDDEEIKGWITLKQDRCRKPYDKTITVFPRQFILSATTNNCEYLKDPTGNRRYWPFKCTKVEIEKIVKDREQLWAEAVHYYKEGLYIGPTEDEKKLAQIAQEKRRSVDMWEDEILVLVKRLDTSETQGVSVKQILDNMGFGVKDQDQRAARRVTSVLQQNGYINKVTRDKNEVKRVWIKEKKDDK